MARQAQDITDAELSVMDVLWTNRACTVREISTILYPDGGASYHATVQKLLDRLRTKQHVARDTSVWPHKFRPLLERGELVALRLRSTASQLCGGQLDPLLSHLVKEGSLSQEERKSLRELLDELDDNRE